MAVILDIVQGTTARQGPFNLKVDGVSQSLAGFLVTMQLRGRGDSTYVDTAGDTQVDPDQVANEGDVYWEPDASDLDYLKSNYTMRFKVVDGAGKIAFWPNSDADEIRVFRP